MASSMQLVQREPLQFRCSLSYHLQRGVFRWLIWISCSMARGLVQPIRKHHLLLTHLRDVRVVLDVATMGIPKQLHCYLLQSFLGQFVWMRMHDPYSLENYFLLWIVSQQLLGWLWSRCLVRLQPMVEPLVELLLQRMCREHILINIQ